MVERRRWRDLTPAQRAGTIALGAVQVALFAAAQIDLWRRPAYEVRGRKWVWAALAFVNVLGPLAYFAYGRRPSHDKRACQSENGSHPGVMFRT